MDGREGIPSFYLNGGFRGPGSGSNVGSGNQGGGFQVAPPGFKTQSNPNLSHHGHGNNMRLAPSVGSSFHLEHNTPTPPQHGFPHGFNMDGGGGTGGGVSDDGGGAATISTHGSGNESVVKKRRGRPRKYAPEGNHVALALTPAPAVGTPDPTTPTTQKKRGRPCGTGRKQQLANVGEWMHNSAGSAFTPHIIHISVGEDVAEKILLFAQQRQRALCVLSGSGSVSTVTLRQFTASGGTVAYEGRFEILCLSGCYLLAETGGPRNRTGGLSVSVCNADGQVIGGALGGKLIASTLVQVVVSSFLYGGGDNSKAKTAGEPPSGDEKSPGVQLN
ncbi:hypothetical protein M8C21_028022 [Ambrosia artemisiifolia]|uniref:AT-hook motif nuclear-localized protein n=1 Tax=Ambrosia artemisiifolia TaxID=4212 RepID=A0AAD5GG12_AMBAR|nr:hypothetical protein M8C21_028022 [Ambrosia artemisiifolia]